MYYLPLFGIRRVPGPSATAFVTRKFNNSYLEKHLRRELSLAMAEAQAVNSEIHYRNRLADLLEYVRIKWVLEQQKYHSDNERKYKLLDERLERRVNRFNQLVIAAVALDILWSIAHVLGWLPEKAGCFLHYIGTPLILITATIIPAMVASFNALRFQTEARSLAERSGAMAKMLGPQNKKDDKPVDDIDSK